MAQSSFATFEAKALTIKERRILLLIRESCPVPIIERTTGIPRSSIYAAIRKMEKAGLIRRYEDQKYNVLYELSDIAQDQLASEGIPKLTPFKVHCIGYKFHVRKVAGELSKDNRISPAQKSWKNRSGEHRNYTFLGKPGQLIVSVTAHPLKNPKTIIVQLDKGQRAAGTNVDDAISRAYQRCSQVKDEFIRLQREFGCRIETEEQGSPLYKNEHVGFFVQKGGEFDKGVTRPGWWADKSKDLAEIETTSGNNDITPVDKVLKAAIEIPDIIKQAIDPLSINVQKVQALVQGGTTAQQTVVQLMGVIGKMMENQNLLLRKIEDLEKKIG